MVGISFAGKNNFNVGGAISAGLGEEEALLDGRPQRIRRGVAQCNGHVGARAEADATGDAQIGIGHGQILVLAPLRQLCHLDGLIGAVKGTAGTARTFFVENLHARRLFLAARPPRQNGQSTPHNQQRSPHQPCCPPLGGQVKQENGVKCHPIGQLQGVGTHGQARWEEGGTQHQNGRHAHQPRRVGEPFRPTEPLDVVPEKEGGDEEEQDVNDEDEEEELPALPRLQAHQPRLHRLAPRGGQGGHKAAGNELGTAVPHQPIACHACAPHQP